jgi:hypothetical protein
MRQSLQSAVPLLALALLVSQANAFVPAAPALPAMATAAARVLSRSQGEHLFVIRGARPAVHLDAAAALERLPNTCNRPHEALFACTLCCSLQVVCQRRYTVRHSSFQRRL